MVTYGPNAHNYLITFFQFTLEGTNRLKVEAGDYLGFSWMEGGVVCFSDAGTVRGKYCAAEAVPNLGDTIVLQQGSTTNRDYAIRVRYQPLATVGK